MHEHAFMDEIELFHVTPEPFEKPNFDILRSMLASDETSAKGILGFWMSPRPDLCESFGPASAKVVLASDAKPFVISVSTIYALHRAMSKQQFTQAQSLDSYEALRERLSKIGNLLFIKDAGMKVGEVVAVTEAVVERLDFIPNYDWRGAKKSTDVDIPAAWIQSAASLKAESIATDLIEEVTCGAFAGGPRKLNAAKALAFAESLRARGALSCPM